MFYVIAFIIFVVAGLVMIFASGAQAAKPTSPESEVSYKEIPTDCCGAHEICEFDEYNFNEEIILYFEDEELDALRNVREEQLTPNQIDDLRDVLYTLQTSEIKKWLVSLSRRHIHLPLILQQEARQLMAEG